MSLGDTQGYLLYLLAAPPTQASCPDPSLPLSRLPFFFSSACLPPSLSSLLLCCSPFPPKSVMFDRFRHTWFSSFVTLKWDSASLHFLLPICKAGALRVVTGNGQAASNQARIWVVHLACMRAQDISLQPCEVSIVITSLDRSRG